MNLSEPFIRRPVATTLLTLAVALAGMLAYFSLPVSPLPQVEFPVIQVQAGLPGASPEIMASAVATPLERQLGHIAGVNEMTSSSGLGNASITLQFDLTRDIDAAARDVQAAINAAAGQLPTNLPGKPTYRKSNPSDSPVLILALTSDLYNRGQMYDAASTILQQKISQVDGVGQVTVGGGALPAVRVDVNPTSLNNMGLSLADVRTTLNNANANRPKGQISGDRQSWTINTSDQLLKASEYQPLIVSYKNGSTVRLSDIATVTDSVEDTRTGGLANGKPSIALVIYRQPGANIISTVDRVLDLMPQLQASIPPGMKLAKMMDRTTTIRASVFDTEKTMVISIFLVILVVFVFLRDVRTTLIPSVAVPISLIGTFGVMYLIGYSIDNLSLMALTIATGFVVDDAIVVIENVTRYLEQGYKPLDAALRGAREIGFTVISMSISLIAVFIPILLMGGIVGRLFREFAVTLSVAVAISLVVSLTTTPMMCAALLRHKRPEEHGRIYRATEWVFQKILGGYEVILAFVLRHPLMTIVATVITITLNVYLYVQIPKELFPQQDGGRLIGRIQADQGTSSQAMKGLIARFSKTTGEDPAVEGTVAFAGGGGGTSNTGTMFVMLKPLAERKLTGDQVIARLRGKLSGIAGATLLLQTSQDLRIGGRGGNAQYQYTISGDNLKDLTDWSPKLLKKMKSLPGLVDVNSDQQNHGLEAYLTIDRETAAKQGLTPQSIDDALYDAFGQRQVSTMYSQLNQYHVVMEVDPQYTADSSGLKHVYTFAPGPNGENPVPLDATTKMAAQSTALVVNHQSQFPSTTISFNLIPGMSLGTAVEEVQQAGQELHLPQSIHGKFAGTAQAYQDSVANEPILIAAALAAVYIVLGMLYESLIHPVTILSTLPSAGLGALIALIVCRTSLSLIALIGIILLIGIVKKNAILMIDFALETERRDGKSPRDAIFEACLLRFRPITMTTMAAMLGGLPLAFGNGVGSELRRPLGIAIVGGLLVSQVLTLFTTPVIYLYMDRFRLWTRKKIVGRAAAPHAVEARHA